MGEDVLDLLEEFARRFAAGERPDAREYLARADEGAPRLAALLERFAVSAAPPDPDEDQVAALRAWLGGEPPLLELRRRRGLRREAVVDALVRSLSLDPAKRDRVAGYYHRLETGQLAPERVDRRVFAALAARAARPRRGSPPLARPAPPRRARLLPRRRRAARRGAGRAPAPAAARARGAGRDRPPLHRRPLKIAPRSMTTGDMPGPVTDPRAGELLARHRELFGGPDLPVPVESIAEDLLGLRSRRVRRPPGVGSPPPARAERSG